MSNRNKWVQACLGRLQFGQFLEKAAEWLASFLIIFGCLVLLVKLLLPGYWPHVLWVGILAIPCTMGAWWVSQLKNFSWSETVAYLDTRINAGGLLMSLYETSDQQWDARLPQYETRWSASLPRIRPKRFASLITMPLLFAIAVCFVPLREAASNIVERNIVSTEAVDDLQDVLDELKKEEVLEEEEQEELQEQIERLKQETAQTPLTNENWETIDTIQQKMLQRLDQRNRMLQKASKAVAELGKALKENNRLTNKQTEDLEQELQKTLEKMGLSKETGAGEKKEGQGQKQQGGKQQGEGQQGSKSGGLPKDKEARQKALDKLKQRLDKECKECEGLQGKCTGKQSSGKGKKPGKKPGAAPGKGGVTRGPGAAPLTWGDENDPSGTKFKEAVLPPGYLEDPSDQVIGITRAAPNEDPAKTAPRSKARGYDPSAGRETWNRTLRPKHRKVVRGYFNSRNE